MLKAHGRGLEYLADVPAIPQCRFFYLLHMPESICMCDTPRDSTLLGGKGEGERAVG
jgi:hypothetical protein